MSKKRDATIGSKAILGVLQLIDAGDLHVDQISEYEGGNVRFRVREVPIEFVVFFDAGDWDYFDAVYYRGQLIADYGKMNQGPPEQRSDFYELSNAELSEMEGWWEIGRLTMNWGLRHA